MHIASNLILLLAASKRHSSDPAETLIIAGIVAAIFAVVFVVSIIKSCIESRQKEEMDSAANLNYMKWRSKVSREGGISSRKVNITLSKGESCYQSFAATLYEPRAVRVSRHGGYGVRATRSIGIFEGESRSESHDEWRAVCCGMLYITDKRIVFAGDMQSREIKLGEIISTSADSRSLIVRSSKRQKAMCFTGLNGLIARDTISMIVSE